MNRGAKRAITWIVLQVVFGAMNSAAPAQQFKARDPSQELSTPADKELSAAPEKVVVQPIARDYEIQNRLIGVLEATRWFEDPEVKVEDGVVFLNGRTETDELKKWAGNLARNTQDVVAVVNRIEVKEPSVWSFARSGLRDLWRDFLRFLPYFIFGLIVLAISFFAAIFTARGTSIFLKNRVRPRLLRTVIARAIGLIVFLLGIYIVLRTSGLTQLALTVIGGTGLLGLVLGIAFRDITENFLASIFLSMQQPFATGDLVEIDGVSGYVQQLNVRTTVLMTFEGNIVQIPNATVYKTKVRNFTTNINRRDDFVVGIGYDDSIQQAQEIALKVIADHPAVLNDPEPAVLADSFGRATVNLRVYFWLNGTEHSWLKVRSSVIRLVKIAFQKSGISMPDEAREVIFPAGVPVRMVDGEDRRERATRQKEPGIAPRPPAEQEEITTKAEAGLYSEAEVIKQQGQQARPLEREENLLENNPKAE